MNFSLTLEFNASVILWYFEQEYQTNNRYANLFITASKFLNDLSFVVTKTSYDDPIGIRYAPVRLGVIRLD